MLILLLKFSRKAPKVPGRGIECQQEDFKSGVILDEILWL